MQMRDHILNLWKSWDDAEAKQIAAMNLFLDAPVTQRRVEIEKLKNEVGECDAAGPVIPENWLRGQFNILCFGSSYVVLIGSDQANTGQCC